jgi:hypothetical protein
MRWIFMFFGLAGLALILLAGAKAYGRYQLSNESQRVTGRVVAHFENSAGVMVTEEPPVGGGRRSYFPVVEFPGADGVPIRFTAGVGGGAEPRFKLGTAVEVLYSRHRPAEATLTEMEDLWGTTIAAAVFGGMFLLLGVVGYWFVRNDGP